ncbi:hypothetical protein DFH06DRAFT_1290683 [Mycena polygramma]|nr:hypothetical protein DFH06DRAFT_1290683 [Mycena polygramma]
MMFCAFLIQMLIPSREHSAKSRERTYAPSLNMRIKPKATLSPPSLTCWGPGHGAKLRKTPSYDLHEVTDSRVKIRPRFKSASRIQDLVCSREGPSPANSRLLGATMLQFRRRSGKTDTQDHDIEQYASASLGPISFPCLPAGPGRNIPRAIPFPPCTAKRRPAQDREDYESPLCSSNIRVPMSPVQSRCRPAIQTFPNPHAFTPDEPSSVLSSSIGSSSSGSEILKLFCRRPPLC